MTIEFPRALLRERSHSWNLRGSAMTGGLTSQSVAQLVRSDGGGFWNCTMSDISLSGSKGAGLRDRDRQRVSTLLWRAVRQIADGGVTPLVVPRNDALFRPWPAGLAQGADGLPHSDGSFFGDGAGYYQPTIDIVSEGAADLRATSLGVRINVAGQLIGGESFSINHDAMDWRLYEIKTVTYDDDDDELATITFHPPLREAVARGTQLEFDRPRCLMRLADTGSMDLTIVPWTFNSAGVQFIEAFR